jgi:hypothetical protein
MSHSPRTRCILVPSGRVERSSWTGINSRTTFTYFSLVVVTWLAKVFVKWKAKKVRGDKKDDQNLSLKVFEPPFKFSTIQFLCLFTLTFFPAIIEAVIKKIYESNKNRFFSCFLIFFGPYEDHPLILRTRAVLGYVIQLVTFNFRPIPHPHPTPPPHTHAQKNSWQKWSRKKYR